MVSSNSSASPNALAPGLQVRPAHATLLGASRPLRRILVAGHEIGRLSELAPSLIETGRAAILDLDLDLLRELTPARACYTPVRRFPTSAFDLSIVADVREPAGNLEREIRRLAGDLAESVDYVREYQGDRLPEGKKSVSFRVVAGAPDRTLTADEISGLRKTIIDGLTALGYELRV